MQGPLGVEPGSQRALCMDTGQLASLSTPWGFCSVQWTRRATAASSLRQMHEGPRAGLAGARMDRGGPHWQFCLQHLPLRRDGVHLRALPRYSVPCWVLRSPFGDDVLGGLVMPLRNQGPGLAWTDSNFPRHPLRPYTGSGLWLESVDTVGSVQPELQCRHPTALPGGHCTPCCLWGS